jgi:hypothetical protein
VREPTRQPARFGDALLGVALGIAIVLGLILAGVSTDMRAATVGSRAALTRAAFGLPFAWATQDERQIPGRPAAFPSQVGFENPRRVPTTIHGGWLTVDTAFWILLLIATVVTVRFIARALLRSARIVAARIVAAQSGSAQ